tara:strand:+ start:478 stop:750 length:273 start_codon:yes stop_codon:yes gene_type:complete
MQIYKFKDTTTTEYTIQASNQDRAIELLDKIWWTKQLSIKKFIYKNNVKVNQRIWIEFENLPQHICTEFVTGDDEDKKYCIDCWIYKEND